MGLWLIEKVTHNACVAQIPSHLGRYQCLNHSGRSKGECENHVKTM
jgi:hypothetical protein